MNTEFCPGYRLPQWRHDGAVNRDERLCFSTIAARSPHLEGVVEAILQDAGRAEVNCRGHVAAGLLAAILLDGIAISWASSEHWNTALLNVQYGRLSELGDFEQFDEAVRHASHPEHWKAHAEWIKRKQQTDIKDGVSLLEQSLQLFRICGNKMPTGKYRT